MNFNFISIILLLGIAQGILLSLIIFHRHRKVFANRFLGLMMITSVLSLSHVLFSDLGLYKFQPFVMLIDLGAIFLVGPLHYLYAKHLIQPLSSFKRIEWLHFLPAIFYQLITIYYLISSDLIGATEQDFLAKIHPVTFLIINWVFVIQMLTYMVFTILLLGKYATKIKNVFSTIENIQLNWLRNITYMATFVIFIFTVENFLVIYDLNISSFNLSSILGAIYVYTMGYIGLSKSEIFGKKEIVASIEESRMVSEQDANAGKYQKSGLSKEEAGSYAKQLLTLMSSDQLYTDSTLTLQKLAIELNISTHHLSEIINTQLNQNFFDFVNQYRVNKVIEDMKSEKKEHLTLLGIALDSGFNSKSSFNTIFKKHTGITPSAYKLKLKEELEPA